MHNTTTKRVAINKEMPNPHLASVCPEIGFVLFELALFVLDRLRRFVAWCWLGSFGLCFSLLVTVFPRWMRTLLLSLRFLGLKCLLGGLSLTEGGGGLGLAFGD